MTRALVAALVLGIVAGVASPVRAAGPEYGDLSHLTFTATRDLHAAIVEPRPNAAAATLATSVEVVVGEGQGAEVRIDGAVVPATKLGKRVIDRARHETRYVFYGVPLRAGPNALEVTPLGANGARGTPVSETVYGPGEPASLRARFLGKPVADGRTPIQLEIDAFDSWGHLAAPGSSVEVALLDNRVAFADSPLRRLRFQLEDGRRIVRLLPSLQSGNAAVDVSVGDLRDVARTFVAPDLRAPLVVGLVTGGVGSVPGSPGADPTVANGANSRYGRIAVSATGSIDAKTLVTATYDTADVLTQTNGFGTYVNVQPSLTYDTFGDASRLTDDALSRDHLYLRFDRGASRALWGEFNATGSQDGSTPDFSLLVSGAQLTLHGNNLATTLFAARNDVAYARQVYNPLGLSTLGNLLHPDIVVGSETVTVAALDRATGAILTQTALTRNVDYTIDYGSGQIRFITIPLPFDANFNPQVIVVQYEYSGPGTSAETSGGNADLKLGRSGRTHLGVDYLNDAYGSGNLALLGEHLWGAIGGGTWEISHLTSAGTLHVQSGAISSGQSGGQSYNATLHAVDGANRYDATFDATSAGFNDPFGGLSSPGFLDYRLEYERYVNAHQSFDVSVDHEQNNVAGVASSQSNAHVELRRGLGARVAAHVGLTARTGTGVGGAVVSAPIDQPVNPAPATSPNAPATAPGNSGSAVQSDVGLDWWVSPAVKASVSRQFDLGASTSAYAPEETQAEVDADLSHHGRAFVRELWTSQPTASFAASTAQFATSALGTHEVAVGLQRDLSPTTSVESQYALQQTNSGENVFSETGIHQRIAISKRVAGEAFYQHGIAVGQGVGGFDLYGTTLTYADPFGRMRATGSYQLRTGSSSGSSLLLAATGAISPVFSVFGSINDSNAYGFSSEDLRTSLAYRPAWNDRGVTLLGFEHKSGSVTALGGTSETMSLDHLERPSGVAEVAFHYAYKLDGDTYYGAKSDLLGVRFSQRFGGPGGRFDVAAETRAFDIRGIAGASGTAFAAELGYYLTPSMRVATGYNFSGSPDPQLLGAPDRQGAYATLTSTIDSIFGWGKSTK